jgi:hypothetical protein
MSEVMARALNADSPKSVVVAGKNCTVRGLGIAELTEVERDCLQRFKRMYLQSFAENIDLLPKEKGVELLEKKLDEVAKWDVENLPPKYAHDPRSLVLTEELIKWVNNEFPFISDSEERSEEKTKRVVATALDQGILSEEEYIRMTKFNPPKYKVPYVSWWITGSTDGIITMVYTCFKHNGVTREQVLEAMSGSRQKLIDIAHEIERLSVPQVGNG